jgi:hypothetical protein
MRAAVGDGTINIPCRHNDYADEAAPESPSDLCFEPLPELCAAANPRLTASARASMVLRALPRSMICPSAAATSQRHWREPRSS